MYKHVGKPAFFVTLLIIAALCYVTIFGLINPFNPTTGDTKNWIIQGVSNLRLGIDIRGGIDVTFSPPDGVNASDADMNAATSIINNRLDQNHITDRYVSTDLKNKRIIVRYPWKPGETNKDPEKAIAELGAMANLNFKGPDGTVILTGKDVESAAAKPTAGTSIKGKYYIELKFKSSGAAKFAAATKKYLNKTITINMDNKQISAPTVDSEITEGNAIIEGTDFTAESANNLANQINGGALPFALKTNNISAISATLGETALSVMLTAGIIAFILICLFMILYYRLPGLIACFGLCGHVAGTVFAMLIPAFSFTLTLPGIAGIILSIGMGVDCNIITAERIKEQLRAGRTLDAAIDQGFDMSFSAIFDGNITVIIVGIILMWKGSATVLSFGFTLIAGVVFNFLMGIIASRVMLKSVSKFNGLRNNFLYGEAAK